MKRKPVKVYLSSETIEMLDRAREAVGEDRSEYIRTVLLNDLRGLSLIRERLHPGEDIPERPRAHAP